MGGGGTNKKGTFWREKKGTLQSEISKRKFTILYTSVYRLPYIDDDDDDDVDNDNNITLKV